MISMELNYLYTLPLDVLDMVVHLMTYLCSSRTCKEIVGSKTSWAGLFTSPHHAPPLKCPTRTHTPLIFVANK